MALPAKVVKKRPTRLKYIVKTVGVSKPNKSHKNRIVMGVFAVFVNVILLSGLLLYFAGSSTPNPSADFFSSQNSRVFKYENLRLPFTEKGILNPVADAIPPEPAKEQKLDKDMQYAQEFATKASASNDQDGLSFPTVQDPNWQIVATADFNEDKHDDLLWYNSGTFAVNIWFIKGTRLMGVQSLPGISDSNWQITAAADFNGDKQIDLLWRNKDKKLGSDAFLLWFMKSKEVLQAVPFEIEIDRSWNWDVVSSTDENADGIVDLILHNQSGESNYSDSIMVYYLDLVEGKIQFKDAKWMLSEKDLDFKNSKENTLISVKDINYDGYLDLIFRKNELAKEPGQIFVWLLDNQVKMAEINLSTTQALDYQPFMLFNEQEQKHTIWWFKKHNPGNATDNCSGYNSLWILQNIYKGKIEVQTEFNKC